MSWPGSRQNCRSSAPLTLALASPIDLYLRLHTCAGCGTLTRCGSDMHKPMRGASKHEIETAGRLW